jgi:hypothetical protein
MKRIIPFSLLLILSLTIFAAFRSNPDQRTAAFTNYLSQLGYNVPHQGTQRYLILTENGCRGCSREIRDEWAKIDHVGLHVTTIVVYYNQSRPEKFADLENSDLHPVIDDQWNLLFKHANLGMVTDGLVEVNNGAVTYSESIDKNNISTIFARLGISSNI